MATKFEYFDTAPLTVTTNIFGAFWRSQTFTPSAEHLITSVKLFLYRVGSPGILTVSIRATDSGKPTGSDINGVTGTTDGNSLTTSSSGEWREITLSSGILLSASTKYAIVIRSAGPNSSNTVKWKLNGTGGYAGGAFVSSTDSGGSWGSPGAEDGGFEEWGLSYISMAATGGGTGTASAVITVGAGEGETFPDERPGINPDKHWDEETGTWISGIVGPGRHKTSVIAIGQGDANEGVIYFKDI